MPRVLWSVRETDANKLDKLVRKAGSVILVVLDSQEVVTEKKVLSKLVSILNISHSILKLKLPMRFHRATKEIIPAGRHCQCQYGYQWTGRLLRSY